MWKDFPPSCSTFRYMDYYIISEKGEHKKQLTLNPATIWPETNSPISRYLFHFQLDFDIGNLPVLLFVKLSHPLFNLYSKSGPILQVRSYITILITCSQGTNLTVNAAQWGHSICCMDGTVYEEWKAAIKFSQ